MIAFQIKSNGGKEKDAIFTSKGAKINFKNFANNLIKMKYKNVVIIMNIKVNAKKVIFLINAMGSDLKFFLKIKIYKNPYQLIYI